MYFNAVILYELDIQSCIKVALKQGLIVLTRERESAKEDNQIQVC